MCGTDDQLWPSCGYSDAITKRLDAASDRHAHAELRYAGAGHAVDLLLPYLPSGGTFADGGRLNLGGNTQADALARADAWPRVLTFLTADRP